MAYPAHGTAAQLQREDILQWGRFFSVDVVLYGQLAVIGGKRVSLELEAFNVSEGAPIAYDRQSTAVNGGGEESVLRIVEGLAARSASKLGAAIIRGARGEPERTEHLEVILKGMSTYRQFMTLRDFLMREVPGVKSVKQTRMRNDFIAIAVEFQGSPATFLQRVLHHEKLPFPIELEEEKEGVFVFRMES
jgi:hypothetical protein